MLTVATMLWRRTGDPFRYGPEHVNALFRALSEHLHIPHRMVCMAVDRAGLDPRIVHVRITQKFVDRSDKRYLKLNLFRRDAAHLFGGVKLLFCDLDVTIVGDLTPLVERTEDFVIWRDPFARSKPNSHRYNSSLMLMTTGCRPEVYETFDAATSPAATRAAGLVGSDQAWIGLTLGPNEAVWTEADGVLGWKQDLAEGETWPEGARMIVNHGRPKAWELPPGHPVRLAYERFSFDPVAASCAL